MCQQIYADGMYIHTLTERFFMSVYLCHRLYPVAYFHFRTGSYEDRAVSVDSGLPFDGDRDAEMKVTQAAFAIIGFIIAGYDLRSTVGL